MKKNPPQPDSKKLFPSFIFFSLFIFLLLIVSASYLSAESIRTGGKVIDSTSLGGGDSGSDPSQLRAIDKGKSLYPRENILGQKSIGPGGFQTGFDPNEKPTWSKWQPLGREIDIEIPGGDDVLNIPPLRSGPVSSLGSLESYKTSPQENPAVIALKIDDMVNSLSPAVKNLATNASLADGGLPDYMMRSTDRMVTATNGMYADIQGMFGEVDVMKEQLDLNYATFNNSDQTPGEIQQFNSQSDLMADRVSGMRKSMGGMTSRVQSDRDLIDGMTEVLDEMTQNSDRVLGYYDQLGKHIKDVSTRFEAMAKDLEKQGLAGRESVEETRQYLSSLREYVNGNKPYTMREVGYINEVKTYLKNTQKYLGDCVKEFERTTANLEETEKYFRKAKIDAGVERGIVTVEEAAGEGACAGAKKENLSPLHECAKSCRSVCRWKEDVGGVDCYECPSGSPDTCYDLKPPAWPDNHPWCKPGGVCHSDPMMYCEPFGAIGPNLEKLQCTRCKQRPDECWKEVDPETTTLTNCRLGCWDGKCVYKGKYKKNEWDGTPEFIHCYKCVRPPGPPSCEDLGWGTTWYSDCKANCPDPADCEKFNTKVPGAPPQPPQPPGQPPGGQPGDQQGGDQGGQQGGGQQGGGQQGGGSTTSGGGPTGGGGGGKANPPIGTPTQPGGGGGAVAGGGAPSGQPTEVKGGEDKQTAQAPQEPPSTQPKQPPQPNTQAKPKPPEPPPRPPDNSSIAFYKKWLEETKERIKSREEILASKTEGEETKKEAQRQLESMTKDKEYVEGRIQEEEQKELEKQRQEAEAKKRQEEYERTRVRRDYGAEMRRAEQEYKLKKLKEATEELKTSLEEMRDTLTGRRERIQKIDEEIAQIQGQSTQTKESQQRLKDLQNMRNQFTKKLQEIQRKYNEELARLKSEYQKRYWAVNENARRRADAERTDEYFNLYDELRYKRATRAARNQTFDQMASNFENAIKDKEAKGEDASDLKRQLENLRRTQTEWNEKMSKQESNLEDQLHELGWRNSSEGAGPSLPETLAESIGRHAGYMEQNITNAEKAIAELEGMTTRTTEQNQQLQDLKAKVGDMRSALTDLRAKQEYVKSPYQLSTEDAQRIHDSTTMVANGSLNREADKSFVRLFAESLGEEYVHNLNPFVMGKKTVAYGWGIAQGVGSAVKGLAELGWEAIDTLGEAAAVDLGFESGGIFGTENLDTINNALSGVSSNANFDGLIKLVVAGGKAIDDKLNELSRSGDIDWATAEFGGKVAGEVVVGDAVIAGAIGKAGTVLRGADEAADIGRAAGKIDDIADAGRAGTKIDDAARAGTAGSHLDDTQRFPPFEPPGTVVDDIAKAGDTAVTKVDDVPPKTPGTETPPTRGPPDAPKAPDAPTTPPRAGVGPNSQATFTGPDGKPVTIRTGEELGHGSTSTVYADPNDVKKAIRITEPGRGGITEAPKLDAAGRQAVESIQRPGGPIRIVEPGNPVRVNDPSSPLNGKIVEVVERVPNGSADNFLKNQPGGTMTQGQAQAFADATKELNNNGFAWMDNHTGNYGFEKVPGTEDGWRVVVLDPGGIVPMKGNSLAEKAANATALQRRINAPDPEMVDLVNSASPGLKQNIAMADRGDIFEQFGDTIDAAAMGLDSPYDIAFYPFGTTEFPQVQGLFR